MSPHLIAIAVLAIVFLVGTVRSVNLGLLAFVSAFAVGTLTFDLEPEAVIGGFPANLFVILVGVTYVFAIAKRNGTVEWLITASVGLVRGRAAALPWVMFAISGLLVGLGALSPAAIAIVAPIALAFAKTYRINPLMMGLMVIIGSSAGNFSPLGVLGVITNEIVARNGIDASPAAIFLGNLVFNIVLAFIVYISLGGMQLARDRRDHLIAAQEPGNGGGGTALMTQKRVDSVQRTITITGLAGLAIGTLAFDMNLGLSAMTVAAVLALIEPDTAKAAIADVSWAVVLLVCGIVTYIALLESQGTVDYLGEGIASVSTPLLAALLLLWIAAVISAFASTTGILGALVPLAAPLLALDHLSAVGLIVALSISASVVDASPFSTNGGLIVANAPVGEQSRVYRGLMRWGMGFVVFAPIVTWVLFVVPGW